VPTEPVEDLEVQHVDGAVAVDRGDGGPDEVRRTGHPVVDDRDQEPLVRVGCHSGRRGERVAADRRGECPLGASDRPQLQQVVDVVGAGVSDEHRGAEHETLFSAGGPAARRPRTSRGLVW
jgi:hypothetical protein